MKSFLRLILSGTAGVLSALISVQAASVEASPESALAGELESQYQTLQHDIGQRAKTALHAQESLRREANILESDRDPADVVLRRTAALLENLKQTPAAANLGGLAKQLSELSQSNAAIAVQDAGARRTLFARACELRRQIAFSNPLLDFDKILFIKRARAGYEHMCDQYYGIYAKPGGGVFVLSNPFSSHPQARNLIADSVVTNGRQKDKKLEGGSYLSPSLSYDGKTVLFAYVDCRGDRNQIIHTDPSRGHWAEGWAYHIFKVGADGSRLEQITDGTWNDFDPCWLPNGRIAFISERRGGYLRCGRECPTYTLYDMAADGSDINCLSFHETNEWHPSVTHDGRIIYTRWDYVDRHGCTAHQPWITTLEGADSRAVHGNFAPRPTRPDMELDVRAVPNSSKYTTTAAPHHGQAFGSLALIDPTVVDDDAMSPLRRITPEVGFPESQGGTETYATAWPLSEDYYLCVYDPDTTLPKKLRKGGQINYGIYLVDSFGNKELIYRDAEISCQSPIPLRPTATPAVTVANTQSAPSPEQPKRIPATPGQPGEATIAVVNAYESLKPWPVGTKIKSLRILQLLPMTVPSGNPPHETGLRVDLAGDSVVPVRYVLGTVPVEEDGSAHFIVPANREILFQALDENGLAVQSMRSATYLHSGERLVCQGCHEPRHRAPQSLAALPLAMRRGPAKLIPDVDGSNPFSYPRLVQPVLERNCVKCHEENKGKAPNLNRDPIQNKWYASYNSLIAKYAFTSYGDGYRTTPGKFGARASRLYSLLSKGHHDLNLSPEDLHRITLWLDCSSLFYGVYEKEGGQTQLMGGIAWPTLE